MYKNILEAKMRNGKWVNGPSSQNWFLASKKGGEKTPRIEIRYQQYFNDTVEPKSTSSKTQIVFLISEGDYGNTGAKTNVVNPKNENLESLPLSKVKKWFPSIKESMKTQKNINLPYPLTEQYQNKFLCMKKWGKWLPREGWTHRKVQVHEGNPREGEWARKNGSNGWVMDWVGLPQHLVSPQVRKTFSKIWRLLQFEFHTAILFPIPMY